MTFNTSANTYMQLSVSPEVRGRVMGLYMLVFVGSAPIGSPLIGWLSEVFGPRSSLIIGGIVSLAAVVGVAVAMTPRPAFALRLRRSET
jgi:MFS family permease